MLSRCSRLLRHSLGASRSFLQPQQSFINHRHLYSLQPPTIPHRTIRPSIQLPFQPCRYNSFRSYKPKKNKNKSSTPKNEQKSEQKPEATKPKEATQESEKKKKVKADEEEEGFGFDFSNFSDKFKSEEDKDQEKKDKDEDEDETPKMNRWVTTGIFVVGTLAVIYYGSIQDEDQALREVSFQQFLHSYVAKGQVRKLVVLRKQVVNVYLEDESTPQVFFSIGSVGSFEEALYNAQLDAGVNVANLIPVHYAHNDAKRTRFLYTASAMAHTALTIAIIYGLVRMTRGALKGANPFGEKKKFTVIMPGEGKGVAFKDVAGLDEAKLEVMEFVSFLRNPERFTNLGAKVPKGALLVGPPGTGKTLLAKATAGEASVPFYSVSGSEFLEMFVGVGPARVRELFKEARKTKPSIIFIDEIDAIGRARSDGAFGGGGNDERENTLNQLLVEMDGFNSEAGIVVLAGTNRADILDKALLRPGRFDRNISVDNADIAGRAQIFQVHLQKLVTQEDKPELAQKLAALTPGFSGADIANICNEAALIAARARKDSIELVDFEGAVDRVIGGLQKRSQMSPSEKKLVAYHEAGHAIVGWFLEHADPLLKVTIVPRTSGALGFAQYLPKEVALYQQDQLEDRMAMILGGRAAEQIFFGVVSTGASDDLEKVTQLASDKVKRYGMSPKLLNMALVGDQQSYAKPFSETTSTIIDAEIQRMVSESYARVLALITEKKDELEALAEKLLELETINHATIVEVLGPRPFGSDAYTQFLEGQRQIMEEGAEEAEVTEKTSS